jgi:shikimate dehydrogenase
MSPVLHRAAYAALGLEGWAFSRDEVGAGQLRAHVARLPAEWLGLSVTMPLKEEALALSVHAGDEAELVGAANTLTRVEGGWRADNTDVSGLEQALREAGLTGARSAVVVGSGATARSALVALSRFGVGRVLFLVRRAVRPGAVSLASRLGMTTRVSTYAEGPTAWGTPSVVVSTVPPGATPPVDTWSPSRGAVVFDVAYAGWPTPWATQWQEAGVSVTRGDRMLLHQAARQVELVTGHPAPVEPMAEALDAALRLTR